MLERGKCRLCLQDRELEQSHITPKFVIRWQHETAVSPIREAERPNLRVQDGKKAPFLCSACEDRFEKHETQFARQIFHPIHGASDLMPSEASYGAFALKFAVSVSWRALKFWSEDARFPDIVGEEKQRLINRALEKWRRFLLDQVPHPAEFEQHVLALSLVEVPIPGQSPSFNRYAMRAVEQSFAHSSEIMFVYSKLGRLALFGMIPPYPRVPGWHNTKLHVRKGAIPLKKATVEIPQAIAELMNERAEYTARAIASVSPTQRAKIDATFNQRIRTNPTGELFDALARDCELFGDDAVNRKFSEDD